MGLYFPNFAELLDIDKIFLEDQDLSWKVSSYTKRDFQLNAACYLPQGVNLKPFLIASYCKGLSISKAHPTKKIIVPELPEREDETDDKDDETQPRQSEEVGMVEHLRDTHAMAAGTRIGKDSWPMWKILIQVQSSIVSSSICVVYLSMNLNGPAFMC